MFSTTLAEIVMPQSNALEDSSDSWKLFHYYTATVSWIIMRNHFMTLRIHR